jgi:integrase
MLFALPGIEGIHLFAGVRPHENKRLKWSAVKKEMIHIGPDVAKTRFQRFVTVEPNLTAWIEKYKSSGMIVTGSGLQRRIVRMRKHANIDQWSPDVLRHCFAI